MRELNHIRAHVTRLFNSQHWNIRSVSILALTAAVLVVMSVSHRHLPPNDLEPLFAGRTLTRSELDRIEAALGTSELAGHRMVEGQLHVPVNQRSRYFAVLEQADCLPETFHTLMTDEFRKRSLMETPQQERRRLQHAKEREAELLIRAIEGVNDAYVRFDETAGVGLRAKKLTTAIVGVTTDSHHPLDPQSVRLIQEMLLGLKAGLTENDITVQDLTAGESYRGGRATSTLALAQHNLERQWMRKLSTVLTFVPRAEIAVRVDTDEQDTTQARSVRVSIGVPSSYVRQLRAQAHNDARTLDDLEAETRQKIQDALLPLLPGAPAETGQAVAVNFFEVPAETAIASSSNPLHLLVTLIVLSVVLGGGAIAILRFTNARQATTAPNLKVYASVDQEESKVVGEHERLEAKLRAYVDEDPDAAAKSLADFIDRAS